MASSQAFGQIIGRQLAHYRERAGLTQPQLADKLAELGFDIGRVTIASIEAAGRDDSTAKNRTRADNATVVDVLALALALDVPPALLFLPIGDVEALEFGRLLVHPEAMLRWVAGDFPLLELRPDSSEFGGRIVGRLDRWTENAQALVLFRELHELQDRVADCARWLDRARRNDPSAEASVEEESRIFDMRLRELDRHHRYMRTAGLSIPDIPEAWAARIDKLSALGSD